MDDNNKKTNHLDIHDFKNDFVRNIHVLYGKKWILILGTAIFTILAILLSFVVPSVYRSEAFYRLPYRQIPLPEAKDTEEESSEVEKKSEKFPLYEENRYEISIPEYKKYAPLFINPIRFVDFLESHNIFESDKLEEIKNTYDFSDDLSKWIQPVYAYSRDDQDESKLSSDTETDYIIGLRLTYENSNPEQTKTFVEALGKFIKEKILYGKLSDYINSRQNNSVTGIIRYENQILKSQFRLEQLGEKQEAIQSINTKYPEFSRAENRQVVSLEETGYRYLSPVAQLVGIESEIADINEELTIYKREKEKAEINLEFFSQMKEFVKNNQSGEAIFHELTPVLDEVFKDKDLNKSTTKEVYNQLTIDIANFKTQSYEEIHFASGPSLPKKNIGTRKSVVVIAGFFIGLFLSLFFVFSLEFWQKYRKDIIRK